MKKIYRVVVISKLTGREFIARTCKDIPFYVRLGNAKNKASNYEKYKVGYDVKVIEYELVQSKIIEI